MPRKRAIMDALIQAGSTPTSIREAALLDAAKVEGAVPAGSMSDAAWADASKLWAGATPLTLPDTAGNTDPDPPPHPKPAS